MIGFPPESLSSFTGIGVRFHRNHCPICNGISVRLRPEYAVTQT